MCGLTSAFGHCGVGGSKFDVFNAWGVKCVGEQKLTVTDSMKAPSVCYQNDELWSLAQKEQRDFIS